MCYAYSWYLILGKNIRVLRSGMFDHEHIAEQWIKMIVTVFILISMGNAVVSSTEKMESAQSLNCRCSSSSRQRPLGRRAPVSKASE